jgi:acetyltransferase-like isoleucine patch superfamily enzyme
MMGRIRLSDKSRGRRLPRAVVNRFLNCAARYLPMFPAMRAMLHRWRGVKVGKRVFIGAEVFIDDAEPDLVVIEDDVTIIARAALLAHAYYPEHLNKYLAEAAGRQGVTIRRGAYVGFGAIVLPGVTVGEEAVIGAGAVVTHDVPPRALVLGVPGKVVRMLDAAPADDKAKAPPSPDEAR